MTSTTINKPATVHSRFDLHTLFAALAGFLAAAAMLVMHVLAGNSMSVADYGLFAGTLAAAQLIAPISSLGANQVAPRIVTDFRGEPRLGTYVKANMVQIIVLATLLGGTYAAISGLSPILVVLAPLVGLRRFGFYLLNGLDRTAVGSMVQETIPSLILAVLFGLHLVRTPDSALRTTGWITTGAVLVLASMWVRSAGVFPLAPLRRQPWIDGLRLGLPALVARVGDIVLERSDVLLVGLLFTRHDLGVYSAGLKLALSVQLGNAVLSQAFAPSFAKLYCDSRLPELRQRFRLAQVSSIVLAVVPVVGLWVAGDQIFAALFGQRYGDAATVARVVSLGQLVNSVTGPTPTMLYMAGRSKQAATGSLAGGFVMLATGIPLSLAFGLVGSALAGAAGYAVRNVYQYWQVKRVLSLRSLDSAEPSSPVVSG